MVSSAANSTAHFTSVEVLLSNCLDYAGTFPPARLTLPEAYRTAHAFRGNGKHAWLMAKSVVPLAQILETTPQQMFELGSDGSPFLFAALSRPPSGDGVTAQGQLLADLSAVHDFNLRFRNGPLQMQIVSMETRLVQNALQQPTSWNDDFKERYASNVRRLGSFCMFFEVATTKSSFDLSHVAAELSRWPSAGLKIRTGGERIPSVEELCAFVLACKQYQLRFKATQNLHHTVTGSGEFGFVNLLAAITLHFARNDFGKEQIIRCLTDEDSSHFVFSAQGLRWQDFELSNEEIEIARRAHWACFGSCSLDEPDEFISDLSRV